MPLTDLILAGWTNGATDVTGNGHDLAKSAPGDSTPGTGPGIDGTPNAAMAFDGNGYWHGDSVAVPGHFTYSAWALVPAGQPATEWDNFALATDAMQLDAAGGHAHWTAVDDLVYNFAAQFETWYHLLATWDGTTQKLFVNGVLRVTSATPPDPITGGTATGLRIGGYSVSRWQYVFLWGRALDDGGVALNVPATMGSEVELMYAGGRGFNPLAAGMQEFVALHAADSTFHLAAEL